MRPGRRACSEAPPRMAFRISITDRKPGPHMGHSLSASPRALPARPRPPPPASLQLARRLALRPQQSVHDQR